MGSGSKFALAPGLRELGLDQVLSCMCATAFSTALFELQEPFLPSAGDGLGAKL
jgi:hypothetical protein